MASHRDARAAMEPVLHGRDVRAPCSAPLGCGRSSNGAVLRGRHYATRLSIWRTAQLCRSGARPFANGATPRDRRGSRHRKPGRNTAGQPRRHRSTTRRRARSGSPPSQVGRRPRPGPPPRHCPGPASSLPSGRTPRHCGPPSRCPTGAGRRSDDARWRGPRRRLSSGCRPAWHCAGWPGRCPARGQGGARWPPACPRCAHSRPQPR